MGNDIDMELIRYLDSAGYEYHKDRNDFRIQFTMPVENIEGVEEFEIEGLACHYLHSNSLELYFIVAEGIPEDKLADVLKAGNCLNTLYIATTVLVDADAGKVAVRLIVDMAKEKVLSREIEVCIERELHSVLGTKLAMEDILTEGKEGCKAVRELFESVDMNLDGLGFSWWNPDYKPDETIIKAMSK
ncbi:hypothetical protein GF312_00415 [Candidatus Poribacteria bacterium]|nr:hypothetical protein [Candidatus Poribacteria bacterium]